VEAHPRTQTGLRTLGKRMGAEGIVPNRPSTDLTLCAAERRSFGASAGGKTWERPNLTAPRVSCRHPPVSRYFWDNARSFNGY